MCVHIICKTYMFFFILLLSFRTCVLCFSVLTFQNSVHTVWCLYSLALSFFLTWFYIYAHTNLNCRPSISFSADKLKAKSPKIFPAWEKLLISCSLGVWLCLFGFRGIPNVWRGKKRETDPKNERLREHKHSTFTHTHRFTFCCFSFIILFVFLVHVHWMGKHAHVEPIWLDGVQRIKRYNTIHRVDI